MEQLIIFIIVVLASIISSAVQNKKKREAERREGEPPPSPGPFERWPKTPSDWQEELRRLLEDKPAPPPIVRPVQPPPLPPVLKRPEPPPVREMAEGDLEFVSPLRESSAAYTRGASLHERVSERMRTIDQQTDTHRSAPPLGRHARLRHGWTRNPRRVREAFVASLIFAPPVALQPFERERVL